MDSHQTKPQSFGGVRLPGLAVTAWVLVGCSGGPSMLEPSGRDAERVVRLWWVMLAAAGVVFAVVLWFLIGSIVRGRRADGAERRGDGEFGSRLIVWGGLIGPAVILVGVFTLSTVDLRAMTQDPEASLDVTVTGNQWWWEVTYPDRGVVTANEIHVPAGEHVRFVLESGDVLHSFWVPESGPKRDMIPGSTNELVLTFPEPSVTRGVCAEFCGLQHAKMQYLVFSQEPDDFEGWVDRQSRPAVQPSTEEERRGREVFLQSACVGCHTIRGVSESGTDGPDLTHLASRTTIAGGVVDLTTENLRRFVADPDRLKPGVLMPPAGLSDDALDDLVSYLESLE